MVKEEVSRLNEKLSLVIDQNKTLRAENKSLAEQCTKLANQLRDTETELDNQQQYSRRNNIIVTGVLESTGEDLLVVFTTIATNLGCPTFRPSKLDIIHRLPQAQATNRPRPIVAKLVRCSTKQRLLKLARESWNRERKNKSQLKASQLGLQGNNSVYFAKHLTVKRAALFRKAKEFKNRFKYKFLWTRNGQILLQRDEQSSTIFVNSEADLQCEEVRVPPPEPTDEGLHDISRA